MSQNWECSFKFYQNVEHHILMLYERKIIRDSCDKLVFEFFIGYHKSPFCIRLKVLFIGDSLIRKHKFYCFQEFPFTNNVSLVLVPTFVLSLFLSFCIYLVLAMFCNSMSYWEVRNGLIDFNGIRTQNHLVCKRTLKDSAKLVKAFG